MSPIRLLKRLLSAAALAATSVSAEAAADAAEIDEAVDESGEPSTELDISNGKPVELGRLSGLVDGLGSVEPGLAAVLVGAALAGAHPVERIAFVCEWATSASVVRRRALARALSQPFSCAGALTAIELLVRDEDALVRSAARQAALLRLSHDPERYKALLDLS